MTGAVLSRTCCTAPRAPAGSPSARQITAQGLRISPELARSSSRSAGLAGRPAPAWADSIQPVTWLGIGREELVSQARTGARSARPGALRQGWTGPLGPRSRRNDYLIANIVVAGKTSTSAAASTPVYFAMTGADAPGDGVEVGFTWSFRAGQRADRGTGAKRVRT
jgi:hypothetical protein